MSNGDKSYYPTDNRGVTLRERMAMEFAKAIIGASPNSDIRYVAAASVELADAVLKNL